MKYSFEEAVSTHIYDHIFTQTIRPSFVVYLNNVFSLPYTGRCAEIGVSGGFNALSMLNKTDITLTAVDNYPPEFLEYPTAEKDAEERLSRFGDRVTVIKKSSVEASEMFEDGYFDYVYIDGSHLYEDVKKDLEVWYPKVRSFGMLAGHDMFLNDVRNAVIEFATNNNLISFGIEANGKQCNLIPWNCAMMCDWWIFKGVRNE